MAWKRTTPVRSSPVLGETISSCASPVASPKVIHPAALSSVRGFQPMLAFSGTVIVPPFEAAVMWSEPMSRAIDGSVPDCATSKDLTTLPPMTTLTEL